MTRQKLFSFLPPLHRFLPSPSRFQKNSFIVSFREKRLVLPIIQLRCFIRLFAHPSVETGRDREKGGKGDQVRPTHVWRGEVTFLGSAAQRSSSSSASKPPSFSSPSPPRSVCDHCPRKMSRPPPAAKPTNVSGTKRGRRQRFPFLSRPPPPRCLTSSLAPNSLPPSFHSWVLPPVRRYGPSKWAVQGRKRRGEGGNFAKTPEEKGRKKEASPL